MHFFALLNISIVYFEISTHTKNKSLQKKEIIFLFFLIKLVLFHEQLDCKGDVNVLD